MAFTLIELLVVIGIVALLVAIGVGAYTGVMSAGKHEETRALLTKAAGIAQEYQDTTGRIVNHYTYPGSGDRDPYHLEELADYDWSDSRYERNVPGATGETDLDADDDQEFIARSIERFVWATHRVPSAQEMYGRVNETVFTDLTGEIPDPVGGDALYTENPNGFLELRDGWDNKIVYAAFVAHDDDHGTHDATDDYLDDDFLPPHDRPFFVSAGPDGDFGNYEDLRNRREGNSHDAARAAAAEDNVYSFDLQSR